MQPHLFAHFVIIVICGERNAPASCVYRRSRSILPGKTKPEPTRPFTFSHQTAFRQSEIGVIIRDDYNEP